MTALAAEFFTLDEVNRLKIIQDVIDRRLTTQMAAQRLGISDRQCRRLLARYRVVYDEEIPAFFGPGRYVQCTCKTSDTS